MRILEGYCFVLLYFAVVIFLVGKIAQKYCGVLFSRKLIHILFGFFWFISDAFFGCSIHPILICFGLSVLAALSKKFNIVKTIEVAANDSNGTVYYAFAILAIMAVSLFVPELYRFVGFAIVALALGDGAATFAGRYIKSRKIYHDKTLSGFFGCIIFTFIGLILYNYLYCDLFNVMDLLIISVVAGIFEEEDLKGMDNITVTFSAFIAAVLLYYVPDLYVAAAAFILLFSACFFFRIMTYHGSLLSAFIGASFLKIGGIPVALFITALYVLLILIHAYRKIKKVKNKDIVKKTEGKDLMQVIANGIVSLMFLYLYLALKSERWLVISLVTFADSFVDSVASDIGSTSKKRPYDIFRKEYVDPGCSGGMSWLGTLSAFAASVVFSAAIAIMQSQSVFVMMYSIIVMNVCCFVDTFMGSCLQVKYRCPKCGLTTEKEYHCGERLPVVSGFRFFNNDTVNLLCSCLCGLLALPIAVI